MPALSTPTNGAGRKAWARGQTARVVSLNRLRHRRRRNSNRVRMMRKTPKAKTKARKIAGGRGSSAGVIAFDRGNAANARLLTAMGLEERGQPLAVHAAKDDSTTIDVYDVIGGYNVNAKMFRQMLTSIKTSKIVVRINSPGGLV